MKVIALVTIVLGIIFLSPLFWPEPPPEPNNQKVIELVDGQQHIGHGKIFFAVFPDTVVDRGFLNGRTWHEGPYIVQKEKVDTMLYLYYKGGTGLQARVRRPASVIRIEND